jgi:phosphoribosyl-ATP pyrophosphohydrolase
MQDIFEELFAVIVDRKVNPKLGSYTVKLLSDIDEALKKVGEEAVEVILAGKGQSDQRLIEESSDLMYHLFVLLVARDIPLDAIRQELQHRRR